MSLDDFKGAHAVVVRAAGDALAAEPQPRSSRRADGNAAILFRETVLALVEQRDMVVSLELATTTVPGCGGASFLCTIHGDCAEWVGGGEDLPSALAAGASKLPGRG